MRDGGLGGGGGMVLGGGFDGGSWTVAKSCSCLGGHCCKGCRRRYFDLSVILI